MVKHTEYNDTAEVFHTDILTVTLYELMAYLEPTAAGVLSFGSES